MDVSKSAYTGLDIHVIVSYFGVKKISIVLVLFGWAQHQRAACVRGVVRVSPQSRTPRMTVVPHGLTVILDGCGVKNWLVAPPAANMVVE